MIHNLNTDTEHLWRIMHGEQTALLRKHNLDSQTHRDFQKGDEIWLTDPKENAIKVLVTHVLRGTEWGLKGDYSMLSFSITEMPERLVEIEG